jgi:hypothetical protein
LDKWVAITAGFSPKDIQLAALRVQKDASKLHKFIDHIIVGPENLIEYAPRTSLLYNEWLSGNYFGHGYFAWKAEIVDSVLNGKHGDCDGIVWIDAGCEIFSTPWTRILFKEQLKKSANDGYGVFELDTPESKYTKHKVRKYFGNEFLTDMSPQVQATHFFLHGQTGKNVARVWLDASLKGIDYLDHSHSQEEEKDFVLHKSDQSLLSLSIKSLKLNERMKVPPAGNRGRLSRYAAMRAPIWVSRNRFGKTLKSKPQLKLEQLFLPRSFLD